MSHNFGTPGYAAAAKPSSAIVEHWRRVHASRAKPEPHDFGSDTASAIECHRYNARFHCEKARWLMRLVEDLS